MPANITPRRSATRVSRNSARSSPIASCLFVDAHEVRAADVEYRPAANRTRRMRSRTFRLTGSMPRDATRLRWLYGLVADPYPLEIRQPDGSSTVEWIEGTNWSDVIDLSKSFTRPTRLEIARQYLWLGYTHILPKGLDHILFVLGIFLLSPRWKTMLLQVTAFTVAHSITLGLSIYGIVSLPSRIVEPLIALSIAYVAIENLLTRELKPWRLALVFMFGLLHGLGFAGVLRELGLPREEFLTALADVQPWRGGRSADGDRRGAGRRGAVHEKRLVPPTRGDTSLAGDCGGRSLLDRHSCADPAKAGHYDYLLDVVPEARTSGCADRRCRRRRPRLSNRRPCRGPSRTRPARGPASPTSRRSCRPSATACACARRRDRRCRRSHRHLCARCRCPTDTSPRP